MRKDKIEKEIARLQGELDRCNYDEDDEAAYDATTKFFGKIALIAGAFIGACCCFGVGISYANHKMAMEKLTAVYGDNPIYRR